MKKDPLDFLRRIHGSMHRVLFRKKDFERMTQELQIIQKESPIEIMTIDETLDELYKGRSICRFGDGEMSIIHGGKIGFQSHDDSLAVALTQILKSTPANCLIAVPDAINTIDGLTKKSREFWVPYMTEKRNWWTDFLSPGNYTYANTNVSRCYIRYQDKNKSTEWFNRLRGLWEGQHILIVEGEKTRMGCGNNFFSRAKSIQRLICPAENAFAKIEEIEGYICRNTSSDKIIVLALGPTATVLAYRLSQKGFRALDLGHCDIEYEWSLMKTSSKVAVKGKYTNEVQGGTNAGDLNDPDYTQQIVMRIE